MVIGLLMATLPVQAQTFEFGPGGLRVSPHGVATVGNCAPPACTRKNWAKPVSGIAAATGSFALAARVPTIITGRLGTEDEDEGPPPARPFRGRVGGLNARWVQNTTNRSYSIWPGLLLTLLAKV